MEQKLEKSLQDVRASVERSSSLLEAKVDFVCVSQAKESREQITKDMEHHLENMQDQVTQKIASAQTTSAESSEYLNTSFDLLASKVEKLESLQKQVLERVDKKLANTFENV